MTLGGLALAIGILVDDFTVTIENTHRLLTEEHMPLPAATLHGSAGIAVPTLVSTLAISCVFTSVIFLHGPAKYLFTPLGLAVVFAMLASYGFSRTLTSITIGLLLKGERHGEGASKGWFQRLFTNFDEAFEHTRGYADLLRTLLTRRMIVPALAMVMFALGGVLSSSSAATFFRSSMAARFSCTCAPRQGRASRRPSKSFRRLRTRSARSYRKANVS